MDATFTDFREAHLKCSGPLLSTTIIPSAPPDDPNRLRRFFNASSNSTVQTDIRTGLLAHSNTTVRFSKLEGNAWVDVYVAYWRAIGELLLIEDGILSNWSTIYEAWKEVTNTLIRGYSSANFESWTIPCLYVTGRYLRAFAIKADDNSRAKRGSMFPAGMQEDIAGGVGKNENLEDAARIINRIFTLCVSDRAPLAESRKWGLYYTTNLLFKTYFKLNSIGLSKNILRALQASKNDMPPIESFPMSHIVTFKYYVGVILFLEEDYVKAEENLTDAWRMCHRNSQRNRELILTYLIPCHLLTTHTLPSTHLLAPFPRLRQLFGDLGRSIRRGDLTGFDEALEAGEGEFVKRRIYLTLERGRDIALRNLLRKVYLAGGFEQQAGGLPLLRRTRIPVAEFAAAIRLGNKTRGPPLENDEVECLLANMIYKNLIKGYISRERAIVVLSKGGSAFPGTGV
ncbi:COP9 signalosome (CSN) subunit [Ptychographa xylographoides]|nr:COP9 signalosome (CSN) subunit [Ptychographa xylographoides]